MSSALPALAVAAAIAAAPALSPAQEYESTGEIRVIAAASGAGASWSADRVVGPNVNMTRREDGGWAGDLLGRNLDLRADEGRLSGPNVNLAFAQKGDRITVEGLFYGARVRVGFDRKKFEGRAGACSLDLSRTKAGNSFHGNFGCLGAGRRLPTSGYGTLQLYGDAASPKPPLEQLALAFVAVLLG